MRFFYSLGAWEHEKEKYLTRFFHSALIQLSPFILCLIHNGFRRETMTYPPVKIWDSFVRVFHWTLVASFALAWLSADELLFVHVIAGYIIAVLILLRLVWGFIGSSHARFQDFIYSPRHVWEYLGEIIRGKPRRYLGHNPAGAVMVLALLAALSITVISGLMLDAYSEFSGPLAPWLSDGKVVCEGLEEVHEFSANATLVLIVIHVLGVVLASWQHRENLVKAMFSGYKHQ
jgi:cytochrome b